MMESIWLVLDRATILIAITSAVFAWWAWSRSTELFEVTRRAAERRRASITIQLATNVDGETRTLELLYKPRRDQLSRQEVLGILGMYYGHERFPPKVVRSMLESGTLERVIEGKLDDSSSNELLGNGLPCETFARFESFVRNKSLSCGE